MEILGRDIDLKHIVWYYCFNALVIIDIILITIAIIFHIPSNVASNIQFFDLIVCIILLGEYAYYLYLSDSKKDFLLDPINLLGLIASIPFDVIFHSMIPGINALRYLRLLRILLLSSRLKFINELLEKTRFHKILAAIFITIMSFTLLFRLFGPSFSGVDDFYFVIVTLTTVGYGDITPKTYNEKVLSMILILIGIIVFSTITATITSYFTDKWDEDDDEKIKAEIKESIDEKTGNIMEELKIARRENNQLKDEIKDLKHEMGELKDLIKKK
jgi:hypothetical protein